MRTRSPVPADLACDRSRHSGVALHVEPLTRVAFLEDILAHWNLHMVGIEKLLKSGSSGR